MKRTTSSIATQIELQFIYWEGRDYGYEWKKQVMGDGDDILLEDLENAIFEHLISIKRWASRTAICRTQAEKAARRVFDRIEASPFGCFSTFIGGCDG